MLISSKQLFLKGILNKFIYILEQDPLIIQNQTMHCWWQILL